MEINIVKFINSNRNVLDLILDLVPIPLFAKDRDGRYVDMFFEQDNELFARGGSQIYEAKITSSTGVGNVDQKIKFDKFFARDMTDETHYC